MVPPEDWTPEEWAALDKELRDLEEVDPEVREARERLDETVADILRQKREEQGEAGER